MIMNKGTVHGGDIYSQRIRLDFSASVHPLGMPDKALEAAKKSLQSADAYPDPFCGALREKLAERLGTGTGDVIFGNGAAELIYHFALALRPKKALLPVPCFSEYAAALRACGSEPVFYRIPRETGFVLPEDFQEQIRPGTELVMLCSPNNPTGRSVLPEQILGILKRCRETGTWLFWDECFYELTDRDRVFSLAGYLKENDRVFVLRAFTKAYGMAGLRLGYGISKNRELMERMCGFCQPWNVSVPAQAAGLAALDCPEWPNLARDLIRSEKPYLKRALSALGMEVLEGDANFLFFTGPEGLAEALKKKGILIRDCADFEGLQKGDYRVAVRTHPENEELIQAVSEVLHG